MIAFLSKYAAGSAAAGIPLAKNAFELMKSSGKKIVPFDFVQRDFSGRGQGDAGGWPSTTGNPSGRYRSNNPPKKYTEQDRDRRGRYIIIKSLYGGDHVNTHFDEEVTSIACGGKNTIMLYENGGTAWTEYLTMSLYNKLNGRQNSLPPPEYVAIGSQDRYYVRFTDGSSEWEGDDAMTKTLQDITNRRVTSVKSVAFGEHWDSHFIVYDDGYWQCQNIPAGLSNILDERGNKADLDCVSLGPDGEYYISAKNGKAWWGGTTNENLASIAEVRDRVEFIDFADDDTFLCRYTL